ncbi:unnamed protein product [Menidia menidia]|uniref:(Atlantic silverside) hypothetical protein n=1 Tax=Menidia menidia TaxID=238744 RepID=A0A8S4BDN3_9TELE|nr:unnamed protein product [Menidia menidia]
MRLLLGGLLLSSLCAPSSWSASSDTLVVIQSPDITVTEGEAVDINCCWTWFERGRHEAAGRYVCEVFVEIPILSTAKGNGTVITVTARANQTGTEGQLQQNSTSSLPLPLIIGLAAVVPVFLVALICFCSLRRKQEAVRVIYEVPHTDSDVAEMDKHSTSSSRGSSQWCQVTVYESFDYFERVEHKGSG